MGLILAIYRSLLKSRWGGGGGGGTPPLFEKKLAKIEVEGWVGSDGGRTPPIRKKLRAPQAKIFVIFDVCILENVDFHEVHMET